MANQIVQVEFHTICGGQLCFNVMHFVGDTAETDKFKIAKDVVLALDETTTNTGFTATKYIAPMSEACFLSALVARVVGASPGSKFPKIYPENSIPGAQPGELYSQQVAVNIQLVTATGPDLTGRVMLPGPPESEIVNNRYSTDYVTILNQWRSDLADGIDVGAVTFLPVVYKRSTHAFEPVTNSQVKPNPGTIRRRLSPY